MIRAQARRVVRAVYAFRCGYCGVTEAQVGEGLALHIVEEENGALRSLTTLGQIYIERLQLNRSALVQNRLERLRLLRIESRLDEMTTTFRSILSEIRTKQL